MTDTIIEILIDNSGSMGYMAGNPEHENKYLIDGQTRMTLIKKIVIEVIVPTIDYANQIIIRTFRANRKTEAEELSMPVIYEGEFNKQEIFAAITSLPDPQPGGTPINAAINEAVSDLEKYPNSNRQIILLTDGEENGASDFKKAAKKAEQLKGLPCKIFIVGIAQDEPSEKKSRQIASGGYYNINSTTFNEDELQKELAQLMTAILQNTIQNFKAVVSNSQLKQQHQPKKGVQAIQQKNQIIKLERTQEAAKQIDQLEIKIKEQISNTQKLLIELSSFKEILRVGALLETGIDSTTLTIDNAYSESVRQKSETYLYKLLCAKHGTAKVNWLNQTGECFGQHDFEILDGRGKVVKLIECKGTSKDKPTFYLTANEWAYFLTHKDLYQVYRVFNVDGEMNARCIENLFASLISGVVVPYLLKVEILNEGRVFLTLTT